MAGEAARRIRGPGTVNHIFRLAGERYLRIPRTEAWVASLEHELEWLPRLAPHVGLAVPRPLARGAPGHGVPFTWAVYDWLPGRPCDGLDANEEEVALDLARFVADLRRIPTTGAPRAGRRPLGELDAETRAALSTVDGSNAREAMAAWDRALRAPPWNGRRVWIHADLIRPNLLVEGGRLRAVLDWGAAGAGDPAADLIAAWSVFGPRGRPTYLAALDPDPGTVERARGYALHQAALIIPYYRDTNPELVAHARRTIVQVLQDLSTT